MAKNLVRDLAHRRVPQILDMRVDRYLLSPHLIDLSILLLGLGNLRLQKDSIAPVPRPLRRGRWRT